MTNHFIEKNASYYTEIEKVIGFDASTITDDLSNEIVEATIAPVYLRRNRKEVLKELPELEIIPQWMDFGEHEQAHYERAVNTG